MTLATDKLVLNRERNVSLVTMLQAVDGEFGKISKRPAVLILPGGGYSMCSDREAELVAYPYLQAGYHAFVLRYSVGEHRKWPNPLNDYEQAMELIRAKAEEWKLLDDKVAVIGFSAGGHLAACAATLAKNRPNAAILGYAAMEKDIAEACQPGTDVPSPTAHVDERTPPCFLFSARDDSTVPVRNTLNFESALVNYGVQFESHIYAYGGHGFGTGEASIAGTGLCRRVPGWVRDSIGWLEDVLGQLSPAGMGTPVCAAKVNGNWEEMLSVDCTISHLKKQNGAAQQLLADNFALLNETASKMFGKSILLTQILGGMPLGEVLKMLSQPEAAIHALDERLREIPNQR